MKLQKALWIGITLTFSLYFFSGFLIGSLAISESVSDANNEVKDMLLGVVALQVKEPIKLGSYLEAKNRIQSFIEHGFFECAEMTLDAGPLIECENKKINYQEFSTEIELFKNSPRNPKLTIYVNNDNLLIKARKRQTVFFVYLFLVGLALLCIVLYFVRKIGTEIMSLASELDHSSPKESLIFEVNLVRKRIDEYLILKAKASEVYIKEKISKQVAHDIRSPISALNLIMGALAEIPEEKRSIIKNSVARINDIANDLLVSSRAKLPKVADVKNDIFGGIQIISLTEVAAELVSEKKVEYSELKNIEIRLDLYDSKNAFVKVDQKILMRVLSNLINNSVESIKVSTPGEIVVSVRSYRDVVQISIRDNGSGIEESILKALGQTGVTCGKSGILGGGNGLGIPHAKEFTELSGGQFKIISKIGVGTVVDLNFKR